MNKVPGPKDHPQALVLQGWLKIREPFQSVETDYICCEDLPHVCDEVLDVVRGFHILTFPHLSSIIHGSKKDGKRSRILRDVSNTSHAMCNIPTLPLLTHLHYRERMYKNRFKAWRWSKNTPIEWMAKKVQQRKVGRKDTVFYWNDQGWTADELAQKKGKAWQDQSGDGKSAQSLSDRELLLIL
jgi:hypothetical protein